MKRPEDQKARDLITGDLDHSMLVEAGAGSGKTKSLVDRMVALIATGRCGVETMAAVTFTRKAAAELQGRFQIELEKAFQMQQSIEKKDLFETALQRLDHLFAGTIHSFCSRLLRERPIEAGLDPDFEDLEEYDNQLLMDQCWSEYLEQLHAAQSPILEKLDELGLSSPEALRSTYHNLCEYPDVEVVRVKKRKPDFEKEKALLDAFLERTWQAIPKTTPDKGWDPMQSALRKAYFRRRCRDMGEDRHFIHVLLALENKAKPTYNRWPEKIGKREEDQYRIFQEAVVTPCLRRWREYCHYFIMDCVVPGVEYFRSVREQRSLMNFQDLLMKAARLLRDHPEVREYFQGRFTHILVDEFQDTDPIQAEMLLYLTGTDVGEKAWQKLRVKPGSLFIVGDPKQSIYRFRRADIDIYNQVKETIRLSGAGIVFLTTNFRSLPSVCDWINPIFEEKFPAQATPYQSCYEKLRPHRAQERGGIRRITIEKVDGNNKHEIARQDAVRIASWIARARDGGVQELDGPVKPEQILILLRYKTFLSVYARELEALSIPFQVSGGGTFGTSEELAALLNMLQALADPEDQISLVATLRGPFFGVSDDLLYRFRSRGGAFSYLMTECGCSDEETRQELAGALERLREFRVWTRNRPVGAVLAMILDSLGIVPSALTQELGESRAGNLMKVLELALQESGEGSVSFSNMVERLRQYSEELELEEMSIQPGRQDAVRIMNLHKAKGLEARVVFLAEPIKDVTYPPEVHITRQGESAAGYFMAMIPSGDFRSKPIGIPPDWERYEEIEDAYRMAEEDRLLYVATTRARELLVVSTYPASSSVGAWKYLIPHLGDVQELATCPTIPRQASGELVSPAAFVNGKQEIHHRFSTCMRSSYDTARVTRSLGDASGGNPSSQDGGSGTSWGRVIHAMLETAGKDANADLDLAARNLLKEEDRSPSEADKVVHLVRSVMSSQLWTRMKKASRALFEVPLSLQVEKSPLPTVMTGVIDLAFKEPDGWVIADYKTDRIGDDPDALVNHYRPQIEQYRRFWEQVSGENVKEAGLFFVSRDKWVPV